MNSTTKNMSSTQILDAVKQLPNKELENFVKEVLVFQANKRVNRLPGIELKLLNDIDRKFSPKKMSRLKALKEQLETENLGEIDYAELDALSDSLEEFHALRVKNLIELANIRGQSLDETMAQTGIKFPDYD